MVNGNAQVAGQRNSTPTGSHRTTEHDPAAGNGAAPDTRYTRTGDTGTTALGDLSRTAKNDSRIIAYGACEEASAVLGTVIALSSGLPDPVLIALATVQNDLIDAAADLGAPVDPQAGNPLRIGDGYVERVERACDHFAEDLPALDSFVLAGGTANAAMLHHARTVVRRAERAAWTAVDDHGEAVNPAVARYLNRLSTLLFILSRDANREHGDVTWRAGMSAAAEQELWEAPEAS